MNKVRKRTKKVSEAEEPEYSKSKRVSEPILLIMKKLFESKAVESNRPVIKHSEIDPTRIITDEFWAISLVRLPDSRNVQHAFLVLEGKTGNKSMIWFADFVANNWRYSWSPGLREGKVRIDYHDSEEVASSSRKLLFLCDKEMMKIRQSDRLLYSTWQISESTAKKLIQNIETQKKKPPKYNILGNSALAASSATLSSNTTGHNCFTFARMMLNDLNHKNIHITQDKLADWVYSVASRFLIDKESNNQNSSTSWITYLIIMCIIVFVLCIYHDHDLIAPLVNIMYTGHSIGNEQ